MHATHLETSERLRSQAQARLADDAHAPADLANLALENPAAVAAAWSGFVPYLAHPVMAAQAQGAMALLDAAAALLPQRHAAPV